MPTEKEEGYVYRAMTPLTKDDLLGLLRSHFEGADALVKRVSWADLIRFSSKEAGSLLENWSEGQIFNANAELRWRTTANGFAVLLLTEQPTLITGFELLKDPPFAVIRPSLKDTHGFLLWGTRLNRNRWWEARIPRPLNYPGFPIGNGENPPQLSYRLYCEDETVCWVRLIRLVEVSHG